MPQIVIPGKLSVHLWCVDVWGCGVSRSEMHCSAEEHSNPSDPKEWWEPAAEPRRITVVCFEDESYKGSNTTRLLRVPAHYEICLLEKNISFCIADFCCWTATFYCKKVQNVHGCFTLSVICLLDLIFCSHSWWINHCLTAFKVQMNTPRCWSLSEYN